MSIEYAENLLGKRRVSKIINIGKLEIGGAKLPLIQSMNNTDTRDVKASLKQLEELYEAGCEIGRLAIPDKIAAKAFKTIVQNSPMPLVADIHFDYRLALLAVEYGAAKIRINPGNIGNQERVKAVVNACKDKNIPIRVGVNSGSIAQKYLKRYGGINVKSILASLNEAVEQLEELDFYDMVLSVKCSDPALSIACYRELAKLSPYPLHLGVTEAGTKYAGSIKSAVGIGCLLAEGIGDTLRVSLTANPLDEILAAKQILAAVGLKREGVSFVSCPTCGRTEVELELLASKVENLLANVKADIQVAVMGCPVNGPGEAREADIGLAGGKGYYLIFAKGEIIKKVKEDVVLEELKNILKMRFNIEV